MLETGCVYIVPLMESLALPDDVAAAANPKSSTGRLDVFTRVITDRAREFDKMPAGYAGPLYLEVSPRTFPILVRAGSRLSQIRFRRGDATPRRRGADRAPPQGDAGRRRAAHRRRPDAVDRSRRRRTRASSATAPSATPASSTSTSAASTTPLDFWEPIPRHWRRELVLDPDQFYILVSREAVHVPPDYAAEMVPFDPLVGEFRVHYAGFFDPGFGHSEAGGTGSRAVLEVRSHEVPFILEHGQIVGRLVYERMTERPQQLYGSDLGSNYQAQGLKLSKHFRRADARAGAIPVIMAGVLRRRAARSRIAYATARRLSGRLRHRLLRISFSSVSSRSASDGGLSQRSRANARESAWRCRSGGGSSAAAPRRRPRAPAPWPAHARPRAPARSG